MKKTVLFLLLMFPMLCSAQSIEVKYSVYSKQRKEMISKLLGNQANQEHRGLLSSLQMEKEDSFCLVVKDRLSSYERIEPEEDLSGGGGAKIILVGSAYSEEDHAVYKDQAAQTMVEVKNLLNKAYVVETALPRYAWKVSSDTKEIMGLKCYRAVQGDSVVAWFCPEIPVGEGPDVYCGLPGLILDLEDARNVYRCMAIDTRSRREVAERKRGKKVSAEQFEALRQQALNR